MLETHSIAIGRGSRAFDPLLRFLTGAVEYSFDLRMTLLRLAYLMYRAKKDEGSACGGDTHVIVVSNKGALAQIAPTEMAVAEVLASKIDDFAIRGFANGYKRRVGGDPADLLYVSIC